jgi:uncharacterized RDD family membrane protein YckC
MADQPPPGDQGPGAPPPGYQPPPPGYPPPLPGYPPPPPGYPPPLPGNPPSPPGYPPQAPGYLPYAYPPQPPSGPVYASFARRFGALILDGIAVAIVVAIIGLAAHLPGFEATSTSSGSASASVTNSGWSSLLALILTAIYFIGSWVYMAGSPAQRMLGVHVYKATGPQVLEMQAAVVRWAILFGVSTAIGAIAIAAPDAVGVVGLVQLAWLIVLAVTTYQSPTKQGLHDRYSGSVVVRD